MAKVKQEDYAYATARIRAREPKLLSRSRLERLFEIKDYSDAVRIMVESGYSNEQADSRKAGLKILMTFFCRACKNFDLICEMIPDPQVLNRSEKDMIILMLLILKAEALKLEVRETYRAGHNWSESC